MAITLTEKNLSRPSEMGERPRDTLLYTLRGTSDDAAAKAHVIANTPGTYDGKPRTRARLTPVFVNDALSAWDVEVDYEFVIVDESFTVDTTGAVQHVTQSLETISSHGTDPEDFGGAINVTDDGVLGVEIPSSVFEFVCQQRRTPAEVTQAYIETLRALQNKTNNATWNVTVKGVSFSFPAGEVLFRGVRIAVTTTEDWDFTYFFGQSPNKTGLSVGSITGIDKKGWEYLWVRYDTEGKPQWAYVERMFETGSFSGIDL